MSSMKKWEYKIVKVQAPGLTKLHHPLVVSEGELKDKDLEEACNIWGEAGWELVQWGNGHHTLPPRVFFKRPKE